MNLTPEFRDTLVIQLKEHRADIFTEQARTMRKIDRIDSPHAEISSAMDEQIRRITTSIYILENMS